jgi:regulator of nucleoside diphosphate kinase
MNASNVIKKEKMPESKVTITVTESDFVRLSNLIQAIRSSKSIDEEYLKFLGIELKKALKIDSKLITPDFVTMNSVMNVSFMNSGRKMELRLVYPHEANFAKGMVSVLSPLGCALLGYKAGDIVAFQAPVGEQKVRIDKVIYQPEAMGENL